MVLAVYNRHVMVKISDDEVKNLARLSGLDLSKDEAEGLKKDMENILEYVGMLDELGLDGVEPTYQVGGLQNVWREDEVIDYGVGRDDLLALAKETKGGQVKVPKVL